MVRVYEADSLQLVALLPAEERATAMAWTRDGQWLAVGGRNRLVTLWSVHEGSRQRILSGHHDAVMKVRFASKQTKILMKTIFQISKNFVKTWIPITATTIVKSLFS